MKTRWPLAEARTVAEEIVNLLRPHCTRIQIAGSIRRQKAEVGDIEILYIGEIKTRQFDLLTSETYNVASQQIDTMLGTGLIERRPNIKGAFTWGGKNKLGIHTPSRIPIDFFATTEPCWWNALVCRTGGKDNNLLITTTARKKGYTFEAYGTGYRNLQGADHHETTSERDVYDFLKLPYLEPHARK